MAPTQSRGRVGSAPRGPTGRLARDVLRQLRSKHRLLTPCTPARKGRTEGGGFRQEWVEGRRQHQHLLSIALDGEEINGCEEAGGKR
eukprot:365498-Chlamydomonas_euryale.AAC.8